MKTKIVEGVSKSAFGKPLDKPLPYRGEASEFENEQEVRDAGKWPNGAQIVDMVNAKEVANIRSQAIQASFKAAGIVAPTLEDDATAIAAQAKILLARGKASDMAQAMELAKNILGL